MKRNLLAVILFIVFASYAKAQGREFGLRA
jgi:hypothetical protein